MKCDSATRCCYLYSSASIINNTAVCLRRRCLPVLSQRSWKSSALAANTEAHTKRNTAKGRYSSVIEVNAVILLLLISSQNSKGHTSYINCTVPFMALCRTERCTKSSAIAERQRDALCRWKFCEVSTSNNGVPLKSVLRVIQGHWQ